MAGNALGVIQRNLLYIGGGKQTNWGTDVAPTWFHKWLDGTKNNDPKIKLSNEMEGDVTQTKTLAYKESQYQDFTIVEYGRPVIAGYALQGLLGTSSDTFTAATATSTLSAQAAAGATSFSTAASIGNVGASVAVGFSTAYGDTTYEVALVNLASRTGTGPYTYNLAGTAAFKKTHASAAAVQLVSTHALAESAVFTYDPYSYEFGSLAESAVFTYDPYSYEFGYGVSGGAVNRVIRVRDAVCYSLKITLAKGKPVKFEHAWYGTVGINKGTANSAITQDTSPPLLYQQGTGNWLLNALSTGNAATIEQLMLTIKRGTGATDLISENLNPAYFLPGALDITGQMTVEFASWQEYDQAYYGTSSAATSATDSIIVGTEALSLNIAPDGLNSFQVSLPTVDFAAATLDPRLDSKPLLQAIQLEAIRPPGQSKLGTFTLTNNNNTTY